MISLFQLYHITTASHTPSLPSSPPPTSYVQVMPDPLHVKEKSKRNFWGSSMKTSKEKEKDTSRNRETSQVPSHHIASHHITPHRIASHRTERYIDLLPLCIDKPWQLISVLHITSQYYTIQYRGAATLLPQMTKRKKRV